MKNQKIELLAPAGSFEALKAAISNGADAVYLGGGKFNARINAGNFSDDELIRALDYAHERGVRIYITLNTLIKNDELEEALRFSAFACQQGADAVIVQDLGLLYLLRRMLPQFEIHASTQMTLTNRQSVNVLEKLGVKRVVLSRELSLEEIGSIAAQCRAELEVFVHGALCVSYSGQCLMSSFVGGRSGNRGVCAQPCRLPWSLSRDGTSFGKDAYLISPRDLMAIEFLPQLKKAGVTSLKLEGRMKSPEYVAIVTYIYRKYLDLMEAMGESGYKVDESDRERLLQAFNRGGFTQSYLKGDRDFRKLVYTKHPKNQGIYLGKVKDLKPLYVRADLEKPLNMGDGIEIMDQEAGPQSIIVTAIQVNGSNVRFADAGTSPWIGDIKTDVSIGSEIYKTLSKPLFEEARTTWERGADDLVPLDMEFTIKIGENPALKVWDGDGNTVIINSEIPAEKAINKPLSIDRISEQLKKMGDTPYWLRELKVNSDGEGTVPISVLNSIRREALEKIRLIRVGRSKKAEISFDYSRNEKIRDKKKNLSLAVFFYEAPDALEGLDGLIKRVYVPSESCDILEKLRRQYQGELFIWTPSVLKDDELDHVKASLKDIAGLFDGISCGSLGALEALKEAFPEKALCADFSMNLFNNEALALQDELGANTCVLSPELRLNEVKAMSSPPSTDIELEALVYGKVPLMTMEHCPSAAETGCSGLCGTCARKTGFLKDRKGEVFPFVRDPVLKRTRIFNTIPIFMDDTGALGETPVSLLRLSFTNEDAESTLAIVRYYAKRLKGCHADSRDAVIIQQLKDKGYTKGHWFRGV